MIDFARLNEFPMIAYAHSSTRISQLHISQFSNEPQNLFTMKLILLLLLLSESFK